MKSVLCFMSTVLLSLSAQAGGESHLQNGNDSFRDMVKGSVVRSLVEKCYSPNLDDAEPNYESETCEQLRAMMDENFSNEINPEVDRIYGQIMNDMPTPGNSRLIELLVPEHKHPRLGDSGIEMRPLDGFYEFKPFNEGKDTDPRWKKRERLDRDDSLYMQLKELLSDDE